MGRIDLQKELLDTFEDMRRKAKECDDAQGGNTFHGGSVFAYDNCIRELKKAMKEAE